MSEKSISIPAELYTEFERIGIIMGHMAKKESPYTAEQVFMKAAEKYLASLDTLKRRESDVLLPVSLSLCTGEGELTCTLNDYVEKNNLRMKPLQQSSGLPISTVYAIASGRVPTLDSLLRLLPSLGFPSLDEIIKRDP